MRLYPKRWVIGEILSCILRTNTSFARHCTLFVIAITLISAMVGCSTPQTSLTKLPPSDPADGLLQSSIKDYLQRTNSPAYSQYDYARADLNHDGLREGIVLFSLPHNYWCERGGCTMMVFAAKEKAFIPIAKITNIRGPVIVSPLDTKGWSDLVVTSSGQDTFDKTVVLMFNGLSYPTSGYNAPSVPYELSLVEGKKLFP